MMNLIRASTSLIVLVLMFSSQSSAKFDPKTLVGAWLFDGNAKDASGNGNDGKLENGPTFVAGKIGQALKFSGGRQNWQSREFRGFRFRTYRTNDIRFLG